MKLLFEKSVSGRASVYLSKCDVPVITLSVDLTRAKDAQLPELSENDVSRHYSELEGRAYGVNTGFYPLGSCTMKYNPKVNEKIANNHNFLSSHPFSPIDLVQGNLEILKMTEELLVEITGMDAFTLQPSAGAQGELVGMMLIRALLEEKGDPRKIVLIPDSAHGTNPSSAHICGYKVQEIKSNKSGTVDLADLSNVMTEDVAALMITNPNTLGVFEF
ncbi:MAG: glycine dehydrogenase (aminomethyl-transferring), partial [Firmicutes bacterium HGW-Firmicutes-16]